MLLSIPINYKGKYVIHLHKTLRNKTHYDLRLEIPYSNLKEYKNKRTPNSPEPKRSKKGLLSFAIPKARLPNDNEKLLVIQTEIHPYQYINFRGKIPKGEYGAGFMSIKDKGTWRLLNKKSDRITFMLKGKLTNAIYTLIKLKTKNRWLMIKHKQNDKYSINNILTLYKINSISAKKFLLMKTKYFTLQEIVNNNKKEYYIITQKGIRKISKFIYYLYKLFFKDFISQQYNFKKIKKQTCIKKIIYSLDYTKYFQKKRLKNWVYYLLNKSTPIKCIIEEAKKNNLDINVIKDIINIYLEEKKETKNNNYINETSLTNFLGPEIGFSNFYNYPFSIFHLP